MFNERPAALPCIACHTALTPATLDGCPRCGADNHAWQGWVSASLREHFICFFLGSPWGRLALVSLLLPLVTWGALGISLLTFEASVLSLSCLLSLTGLFLLFTQRHALSIYEMARRVSPGFGLSLLPLGGVGFLIFIAVTGILLVARGSVWMVNIAPGRLSVVILSLAFTAGALAAGLYAVCAYGRWLARAFLRPIFMDEALLLGLVLRAAKPRIQVKTGGTYEAVTTQVLSFARTHQAGLSLLVRAEAGTDEVWEGHCLKAVRHWQVLADKWGRVAQLTQEGPLEYIPDLDRAYHWPSAAQDDGEILDGELIDIEPAYHSSNRSHSSEAAR